MSPHLFTNFEIQIYYESEPKFNRFYSRNNLIKINDGFYIINLDEYESIYTILISLYVNYNNVTYFDSFGVDIPKKSKIIGNKNVIRNIWRVLSYHSIMCGYICIRFSDFKLKGKGSIEYTNLFSPYDYGKNNKIILNYFQ